MNRRKALKVIAITGPALVLAAKKGEHVPRMVDFRTRPVTVRPSWLPWKRTRSFLNGKDTSEGCFYANEATGEVQCYKTNKDGNFYLECSQGCHKYDRNYLNGFHVYKVVDEKHDVTVAMHPVQRGKVEIRIV